MYNHSQFALLFSLLLLPNSILAKPFFTRVSFLPTIDSDNSLIKVMKKPVFLETKMAKQLQKIPQIQEIENLLRQAEQYTQQGKLKQAIEIFQKVLILSQQTEDKKNEAIANLGIGLNYYYADQLQKTLKYYSKALQISREISDRQLEATILGQLGITYARLGDQEKASEYFQKGHSILGKLNEQIKTPSDPEWWKITPDFEKLYDTSAEKQQELDYLLQELQSIREVNDFPQEVFILYKIGSLYVSLGEPQKSLNYLEESLQTSQKINDKNIIEKILEIEILGSIGAIYYSFGDKGKALNKYENLYRQLFILSEQSNKNLSFPFKNLISSEKKAFYSTLIGNIYADLKYKEKGLEYFKQSLAFYKETNNSEGIAATLSNMGNLYSSLEMKQETLESFQQALSIYDRVLAVKREHLPTAASILKNMAKIYTNLGEIENSLDYFKQALLITQERGDRFGKADILSDIGYLYIKLGEPKKSLDYFTKSLRIYKELGNTYSQARTRAGIALIERNNGNLTKALTQIEYAVDIIEDLRTKFFSSELRQTYFSTVQSYYQFYINLTMELHRQDPDKGYDRRAFEISERSRARTLIELLNEANINIRQGGDHKLLQQEQTLRQQLNALDQRWVELSFSQNTTDSQKTVLEQERNALLDKYENIQAQIRATSPSYSAITQPKPLTLAEVQQQVLDPDTILLQYSLGEAFSYLWVVTQKGIKSYQLPPRKEIETQAKWLYKIIRQGKGNPDILAQAASKLSQTILFPTAEKLNKKRLLIVADGVLQYIPFAVLSFSEKQKFLITDYEIINLPSSSSLATIRYETQARKSAPKAIAILADPVFNQEDQRFTNPNSDLLKQQSSDLNSLALRRSVRSLEGFKKWNRLPGTRQEAEDILKLVPDSQQTHAFDFDANLVTATNPQLNQYRIVHFATHGILNTESPELSGVVLSLVDKNGNPINGFLRLHEIFTLKFSSDLVVVSACETGLGKQIKGEGLIGLTRGFMYAGSPRVLVSLWKVDDQATAEFMTRFYRLMLEKKAPPAEALREAQIEMQKETEWKSPYYWAAFVLQGEWR